VIVGPDEVAHPEAPNRPEHDAGHGVAEDGRGGERDRRAEQYPDQAEKLPARRVADRQDQDDQQDARAGQGQLMIWLRKDWPAPPPPLRASSL